LQRAGLAEFLSGQLQPLWDGVSGRILRILLVPKLLPEPQTKADHGELLRTIGFSSSPGLIRVLGIIPGLGRIVFPIASIWMLIAMIIAVRQALDYKSTSRAIGVCVIGWIIQALIFVFLFGILGGPKPI